MTLHSMAYSHRDLPSLESITDRSTFLEVWQSIVWMGLIRISNDSHTSAVLVYAGISENPAITSNGL
ncbi:protein of unknown function (plasmid) [Cupriavidus taiwanensis]|uniref:Uncharacterized protein n=1 Tax=Cupriavidus taiwanensis TaxID=164546 RepID=A0A375IT22_9BURK|nr:protein of unknown function [Cupriavidus taiwanensis]